MLTLIGRFHPLLVHLPIGILLLALLFAWLGRWQRFQHLREVVRFTLLMGALSAAFSCGTGYLLSLSGEYDWMTLNRHRNLGIAVALCSSLMYLGYSSSWYKRFGFLWQLVLLLLLSAAGHLGGSLTHGGDYLTQAIPEPLRTWLGLPAVVGKAQPIANVPEAQVYAAIIAPLLQEKCVSCHGSSKQKGKLRLDGPDFIQKGGKNGPIIAAGKVADSELIRRLLLPKSDDEHMPPKEKNQLSENEIKLLQWWIESGAHYDKKVKDLPQTAAIQPVLASLQSGSSSAEASTTPSIWPAVEVAAPNTQAIEALKKAGAVVLPLGQNEHFISVNFINKPQVGAKELALLQPLAEQIVSLRLSGAKIDDQTWLKMPDLPQLTKLFLDGTQVSDAGLSKLKSAKHLYYLNLVGTKVSIAGLRQLQALPKLREVYLYQTQVKGHADWQELKRVFPKTSLDTGGYVVPTLASDTTLVTAKPK
jgi:mono/diheme cytochrome c family protein